MRTSKARRIARFAGAVAYVRPFALESRIHGCETRHEFPESPKDNLNSIGLKRRTLNRVFRASRQVPRTFENAAHTAYASQDRRLTATLICCPFKRAQYAGSVLLKQASDKFVIRAPSETSVCSPHRSDRRASGAAISYTVNQIGASRLLKDGMAARFSARFP